MEVKIGDKIRVVYMDGEPGMEGAVGTVRHIDDMGQIHLDEFGLAIIPDVDIYEVLSNV